MGRLLPGRRTGLVFLLGTLKAKFWERQQIKPLTTGTVTHKRRMTAEQAILLLCQVFMMIKILV